MTVREVAPNPTGPERRTRIAGSLDARITGGTQINHSGVLPALCTMTFGFRHPRPPSDRKDKEAERTCLGREFAG